MHIRRVTVEVLENPVDSPYATAGGGAISSTFHVLARARTQDGVEGIGFAVANRGALVKPLALTTEEIGQALVGLPVIGIEAARAKMERAGSLAGPGGMVTLAIAILDIALWDAVGKTLGQPLYRLLGGARDRVPAYASDGLWVNTSLDELAKAAKHHASRGLTRVKLRAGQETRADGEVARVRAVQEAVGPSVQVMVDATGSWDESTAMRMGRALQDAGIVWLEDPVTPENIAGTARVAQALDVCVAGGERLFGLSGLHRLLEARAVDVAIMDVSRVGGITPWMKVAALAEAHGIPVAGHVVPEVHVHLLAAVANGGLVESMPRSEPILKTRLELKGGCLVAPDRPGLGIELDEAACAKYRLG